MKNTFLGFALLLSISASAGERGFSNYFVSWYNLENFESHMVDGQITDIETVRDLLSGDARVQEFEDELCVSKLLKNSRVLANMAVGKQIIGLRVQESTARENFYKLPMFVNENRKSVSVYPVYNEETATAMQPCLIKG